jgi:sterol desaturase/sphingolipid hydroxylase (fatty acid hydroxylase superfamily)
MQHLGWFTRRAQFFRRGQHFHWMHHMILYPIGRFYKRNAEYINSEKGVGITWVLPAVIVAGLFVLTHGLNLGTLAFLGGFYLYAHYIVDVTHSRFHMSKHTWLDKPYFNYLEKMHILHHWDQRKNFTIVIPFLDQLFGTYLSPKGREEEIRMSLEDNELTVSDLMNWRYLLVEATPSEYAAFIANLPKHKRGLIKLDRLLKLLADRIASHPEDEAAKDLRQKALDLMKVIGKTPTP